MRTKTLKPTRAGTAAEVGSVLSRGENRRSSVAQNRVASTVAKAPEGHPDELPRLKVGQILVPTDFSESASRALLYARPLARRFGARLVLLHVVPPRVYAADYGYGPVTRCVPDEDELKAALKHLRSLARSHQRSGQTTAVVRSGAAPEEIIRAARQLKSDLIVMGEGTVGSLASTAAMTMREAPCPVLVVGHTGTELLKPGEDRRSATVGRKV